MTHPTCAHSIHSDVCIQIDFISYKKIMNNKVIKVQRQQNFITLLYTYFKNKLHLRSDVEQLLKSNLSRKPRLSDLIFIKRFTEVD